MQGGSEGRPLPAQGPAGPTAGKPHTSGGSPNRWQVQDSLHFHVATATTRKPLTLPSTLKREGPVPLRRLRPLEAPWPSPWPALSSDFRSFFSDSERPRMKPSCSWVWAFCSSTAAQGKVVAAERMEIDPQLPPGSTRANLATLTLVSAEGSDPKLRPDPLSSRPWHLGAPGHSCQQAGEAGQGWKRRRRGREGQARVRAAWRGRKVGAGPMLEEGARSRPH